MPIAGQRLFELAGFPVAAPSADQQRQKRLSCWMKQD
jgi:hypothetical protein